MVRLVLLVVVLVSVTVQGVNQSQSIKNAPADALKNVLSRTNGYISTFAELLVNLNKILQHFMSNLGTNHVPSTAKIENSLVALVTTNDTQSCTSTEGENLVSLITNTTQALEQCVANFTSDGGTFVIGIYNVLVNVTQLITNSTSNITHCVESNNNLLELPQCVYHQFQYVSSDISALINQLNTILRTSLTAVGSVANTVRSCIVSIVSEFLSSIYNILIDFVNCIEQL